MSQHMRSQGQISTPPPQFNFASLFPSCGPGAAVEPTVCKPEGPGFEPQPLHFVRERLCAIDTLPQTPHSAGSLQHWVRPLCTNDQDGTSNYSNVEIQEQAERNSRNTQHDDPNSYEHRSNNIEVTDHERNELLMWFGPNV